MRTTKEQKEIVVKRYLSGESASAIISEIGISRSALYLWVKQFREGQNDKGNFISVVGYKRLQGKVKRLEEIIQIYKTVNCNYNSTLKEKLYALENLYGQHSVHILCEALDVARGTFYNHILRNKKQNTVIASLNSGNELWRIIKIFYQTIIHLLYSALKKDFCGWLCSSLQQVKGFIRQLIHI